MLEFWDMTPRETAAAIDAAGWRMDRERRLQMSLAWHTAALSRAKKLPSLAQLIKPPPAKKLEGAELEKRKQEFEEMRAGFKVPGAGGRDSHGH